MFEVAGLLDPPAQVGLDKLNSNITIIFHSLEVELGTIEIFVRPKIGNWEKNQGKLGKWPKKLGKQQVKHEETYGEMEET